VTALLPNSQSQAWPNVLPTSGQSRWSPGRRRRWCQSGWGRK